MEEEGGRRLIRMEHKLCVPWQLATLPTTQSHTSHDDEAEERHHLYQRCQFLSHCPIIVAVSPTPPLVKIARGLGWARAIADGHHGH